MPAHHQVPVIRIESIRPHPNADKLEIVDTLGYQTVVVKGQFKLGDLAYFIFPDSVVPQRLEYEFLWAPRTWPDGIVPEKYRRVKAKRLRKEWSEGLLMPLEYHEISKRWTIPQSLIALVDVRDFPVGEGLDIAEALGVTHWEPPEPEVKVHSVYHNFEKGLRPKSFRGWLHWIWWKLGFGKDRMITGFGNMKAPATFPPVYDVENFKNYNSVFEPGEEVVATEKIHGSNARFTFQDGKMYAGSRQFWKAEETECIWRQALISNPWIEEWCRAHEGYALYGEVVPTQGGYSYGAETDEPRVFIFDVLSPTGEWVEIFNPENPQNGLEGEIREHWAPILYKGPFDETILRGLAEGPSAVAVPNPKNTAADTVKTVKQPREGIVVRPRKERLVRGLGRLQLKIVSNTFLEKDNA